MNTAVMSEEQQQDNICAPPVEQQEALPGPSEVEESTVFSEEEKVEEKEEEEKEACTVCGGRKRKADKSCLQCMASDSQAHSSRHKELHSGKRHKADPAKADMAEMIRVNASSPPCPLDGAVALQEDSTSGPLPSPEAWMYHAYQVLEGLNRLRLNSVLCDVILCCEGQEFLCHRVVLASISSYFQAMFTSGTMESTQERVTIDGLEPQIIGNLVNYVYTSRVSIYTENVQALLAASNVWDVTAVREACCDFVSLLHNE